ncbi:MAG: leucine--tRNA ligase, partial [Dehalococcoidia bacterium]
QRTGNPYSVHNQPFPKWDERLAADENFTLVIQVNGKLRDKVDAPVNITGDEARELVLNRDKVKEHLKDATPAKVIYVPGKLINIVVK